MVGDGKPQVVAGDKAPGSHVGREPSRSPFCSTNPHANFPDYQRTHTVVPLNTNPWITVRQAAQLTGISKTTFNNAALDGRIRSSVTKWRGRCGTGTRLRPVRLVHVDDVMKLQRKGFVPANYSGPPSEETLDRLMAVIEQVCRGESWPMTRQESGDLAFTNRGKSA